LWEAHSRTAEFIPLCWEKRKKRNEFRGPTMGRIGFG